MYQGFAVDIVGLSPPAAPRSRNRGRIENTTLNPLALQHAVNPKPIQSRIYTSRPDNALPTGASGERSFERRVRDPNYSVPVTLAIRRIDTMAISSVP